MSTFKKGQDVWAPRSVVTPNLHHHGKIIQIKGGKALVHFEAWESFPELEPELTVKLPLRLLRTYPI